IPFRLYPLRIYLQRVECLVRAAASESKAIGWPRRSAPLQPKTRVCSARPEDGSCTLNPDANRLRYVVMNTPCRLVLAICVAAAAVGAGCARAPSTGLHPTPPGLGQLPYSDADVEFMSGM